MPEASVRTHRKPTTQVLWFTVFAKPSQCATIAIRPEAGKVLFPHALAQANVGTFLDVGHRI